MTASVTFNGLSLDVDPYYIVAIEGLADLPDIGTSDKGRVARSGLIAGRDLYGARTVTITLNVLADTQTAFGTAVNALVVAFAAPIDAPLPLSFTIPGVASGNPARIYVKPRKRSLPITTMWFQSATEATVELGATDALIYSDAELTYTLQGATADVGRSYSRTYSMTYGAAGHPGTVLVNNLGSTTAPVTLTVYGTATNPVLRNTTTGGELGLTADVAAGEFVVLDSAARTVLLNGSADRYSWLTTPDWFGLAPGVNEIQYTGFDVSSSTAQITFRSAWI